MNDGRDGKSSAKKLRNAVVVDDHAYNIYVQCCTLRILRIVSHISVEYVAHKLETANDWL